MKFAEEEIMYSLRSGVEATQFTFLAAVLMIKIHISEEMLNRHKENNNFLEALENNEEESFLWKIKHRFQPIQDLMTNIILGYKRSKFDEELKNQIHHICELLAQGRLFGLNTMLLEENPEFMENYSFDRHLQFLKKYNLGPLTQEGLPWIPALQPCVTPQVEARRVWKCFSRFPFFLEKIKSSPEFTAPIPHLMTADPNMTLAVGEDGQIGVRLPPYLRLKRDM